MRMVCVYTKQYSESEKSAKVCVDSAKQVGYDVEMYPSVYWKDLDAIHAKLNLIKKYEPSFLGVTTETTCPAVRIANGTTHYMLYQWVVKNDEPICIVEHDSRFVGHIPEPKDEGVIQISSHINRQVRKKDLKNCHRANKMRKQQPDFKFIWDNSKGVIRHPLTGLNGTSGYIITPGPAQKMIDYIKKDGVAGADRIRTQRVGEDNLYLQVPQSVICLHNVKSVHLARRNK